jgi:hypothetical protein
VVSPLADRLASAERDSTEEQLKNAPKLDQDDN